MNQFRKAADNLRIVEVHPLEDLLDIGRAQFESTFVHDVADDEVDVLVLADEAGEAAGKVAPGLQVYMGTLVGGVDLRPHPHF